MRTKIKNFKRSRAFSLIEATVASSIGAMTFGGIVFGYVESGRNAEWSAYSLAAQSMAMERVEQCRACKWDPADTPVVDELVSTNFPTLTKVLDVPTKGTNTVYATNYTTVTNLSSSPPLKMITVRAVWRFVNGRLYTNDIVAYRGPNN